MAPSNKKKQQEERGKIPSEVAFENKGKLPPQEVELEEAILGGLILEASWTAKISQLIDADMFYKPNHQAIYQAITSLFKKREPIDVLTVGNELKKLGLYDEAGGSLYLTEITSKITSTANIEYHSLIVLEAFFGREIIRKSHELMQKAYDPMNDVFDVIDEGKTFFNSIGGIKLVKSQTSQTIAKEFKNSILNPTKIVGLRTGLIMLDYRLGGYQNTDLIVIGGRPGKGKTVLAMHALKQCIQDNVIAAVYSYEMKNKQLLQRLGSMFLKIKNNAIRANKLDADQKEKLLFFLSEMETKPKFIMNDSNPDLWTLLAIMERDVLENKARLIILDYLQLVPAPKDLKTKSRNDYLAVVSFQLKSFAKRHNVPVIALAQLSRESEKRIVEDRFTDYKDSDLRECGAIENDADIIMFVDRISKSTKARVQISKFRHGEPHNVSLIWNGDNVSFENNAEDKPTKMAIAHYEQFGEIDTQFEEELKKVNKEIVENIINDYVASPIATEFNPLWADAEPDPDPDKPTPF